MLFTYASNRSFKSVVAGWWRAISFRQFSVRWTRVPSLVLGYSNRCRQHLALRMTDEEEEMNKSSAACNAWQPGRFCAGSVVTKLRHRFTLWHSHLRLQQLRKFDVHAFLPVIFKFPCQRVQRALELFCLEYHNEQHRRWAAAAAAIIQFQWRVPWYVMSFELYRIQHQCHTYLSQSYGLYINWRGNLPLNAFIVFIHATKQQSDCTM